MDTLKDVIMRRDNISEDEFEEMLNDAADRCLAGEDPEELCYEIFQIEPDYVFDIIERSTARNTKR